MDGKIKTVCITFTCEHDFEIARITNFELPTKWAKVWCISTKDSAKLSSIPEGVDLLVRDFDRGEGLRCPGVAEEEAAIFRELAEHYNCIVKKDSDTVLFDATMFSDAIENGIDFTGIKRYDWRGVPVCGGAVYAMSKRGASTLPKAFDKDKSRRFFYAEDLIISNWFAGESGLVMKILPSNSIDIMGVNPMDPNILAGHYGFLPQNDVVEIISKHISARKELLGNSVVIGNNVEVIV